MNIAIMVRGYIPVPRPSDMIYAPIDLAVDIAERLARRGHKVDFYAPLGSKLSWAKVKDLGLPPLIKNSEEFMDLLKDNEKMTQYAPELWDSYLAQKMFEQAAKGKYDILHFHHAESVLPLAKHYTKVPVVYTLHDPISPWRKDVLQLYQTPNQHYISISNNQRRSAPDLPYHSTIHNGIDLNKYPFNSKAEDYLLYIGRIVHEKGVKEAIQVAKATNNRLLIIGPVYPDSLDYFNQHIKPQLNDQILYLGYMEQNLLSPYYRKAKALLTPVQWEEPFGLTTIEAMASGTPVISFNRGAAPELIENGKNGFVVDNTAEMIKAVENIKKIKRPTVREMAEKRFSVKRMVDEYEEAFEDIIEQHTYLSPRFVKIQLRRVPETLRGTSQKRRLKKIIKNSKIKSVRPK
jgi:glycosyltransferase involved in cell wall biosynthesis